MPRSVRPRALWAAAAAAGLAFAYAWWRWEPLEAPTRPEEASEQPETRDKAPLGKLAAGLLAIAAAVAAYFGYQAWSDARENEAVARAITGGDPRHAEAYFARYGCAGCHTIPGVSGADGEVAPPLAGLRRRVYVGGVLRNSPDNLIAWIVDPQRFSPNSAMPATGISPAEARDVAAYLYAH
jgi:cytochrome c